MTKEEKKKGFTNTHQYAPVHTNRHHTKTHQYTPTDNTTHYYTSIHNNNNTHQYTRYTSIHTSTCQQTLYTVTHHYTIIIPIHINTHQQITLHTNMSLHNNNTNTHQQKPLNTKRYQQTLLQNNSVYTCAQLVIYIITHKYTTIHTNRNQYTLHINTHYTITLLHTNIH